MRIYCGAAILLLSHLVAFLVTALPTFSASDKHDVKCDPPVKIEVKKPIPKDICILEDEITIEGVVRLEEGAKPPEVLLVFVNIRKIQLLGLALKPNQDDKNGSYVKKPKNEYKFGAKFKPIVAGKYQIHVDGVSAEKPAGAKAFVVSRDKSPDVSIEVKP